DQREIRRRALDRGDGGLAARGEGHPIPRTLEANPEHLADALLVVDDEHANLTLLAHLSFPYHPQTLLATGSVTMNTHPRPSSELTCIPPPCASTISRARKRPRPPSRSKIRSFFSSATPGP